jgi:hypothetical protein
MDMLRTFKISARAAVVALALGATAFTAMPAQAAPSSSFTLQLGNGGQFGNGVQFGNGNIQLQFGNDFINYCLTNSQIKAELHDHGFRKVQIVKKLSARKVVAVGRYYGTWYEMRIDRCTGKVDKVKKLKKQNISNGFSITLSF